MRFFQVSARKWYWALLALIAYAVLYYVVTLGIGVVSLLLDPALLNDALEGEIKTTPMLFLINNVGIALEIAMCTLIAFLFFKQGFGWLVSVVGRFRWKWMFLTMMIFIIGYAVQTGIEYFLMGPEAMGFNDIEMKPYTWFMIGAIVLTTPLQCAGEEFQARALLPKLIAAIVPFRWVGLTLAAILPSALFMYLHGASDPWLNAYYFLTGLSMWWLAYRTGGIEASIALHIVNNFFALWMLPFTDFSDMFDRGEGTGDPILMAYIGVEFLLIIIVDIVARRTGKVVMSAPAAAIPVVVKPHGLFSKIVDSAHPATESDLPRMDTTRRKLPAEAWVVPEPVSLFPPRQPQGQEPMWDDGVVPAPVMAGPVPEQGLYQVPPYEGYAPAPMESVPAPVPQAIEPPVLPAAMPPQPVEAVLPPLMDSTIPYPPHPGPTPEPIPSIPPAPPAPAVPMEAATFNLDDTMPFKPEWAEPQPPAPPAQHQPAPFIESFSPPAPAPAAPPAPAPVVPPVPEPVAPRVPEPEAPPVPAESSSWKPLPFEEFPPPPEAIPFTGVDTSSPWTPPAKKPKPLPVEYLVAPEPEPVKEPEHPPVVEVASWGAMDDDEAENELQETHPAEEPAAPEALDENPAAPLEVFTPPDPLSYRPPSSETSHIYSPPSPYVVPVLAPFVPASPLGAPPAPRPIRDDSPR
ncbi:MAG: CPBP family glutamic-type intramembrane protease [Propionibacteriaceae bacterium]|nr:CPBP family glutamic-type intramembrane protease [Propionibacteriaceae bacterium]